MMFTLVNLCFNLIWWYVRRHPHLLDPQFDAQNMNAMAQRYVLGLMLYGGAMLVAFVSVPLSIGVYIVLVLVSVVPGSDIQVRRAAARQEAHKQD